MKRLLYLHLIFPPGFQLTIIYIIGNKTSSELPNVQFISYVYIHIRFFTTDSHDKEDFHFQIHFTI